MFWEKKRDNFSELKEKREENVGEFEWNFKSERYLNSWFGCLDILPVCLGSLTIFMTCFQNVHEFLGNFFKILLKIFKFFLKCP